MYERKTQQLLPWPRFLRRFLIASLVAFVLLGVALAMGILGYHYIAGLEWIDALLNASMILTGMGPIAPMTDNASKWFASIYALFSGVIFLSGVGIVLSPLFHRILHHFHLEDDGRN
jgi:putative effector of murein hydrolase